MQNYHTENKIPFNNGKKLIGSYFGKEIVLKWYLQKGLVNFIVPSREALKQFADE